MFVTVFTPTYNRANLIGRVFESLMAQTFRDFEWIIIDDGSTDSTSDVVNGFKLRADFPIKYIARENRGKVASINEALDYAAGEFFLVFDSDDWCTKSALEGFHRAWSKLDRCEQNDYCAVSCLKAYQNGSIVGEDYSGIRQFGGSYIDRFNKRIKGDKWEFIRTSVHRSAKYDLADGERYMAPEYAWLLMGVKYKTIFLNEVLSIIEYQADGISRNNLKYRVNNPKSAARFYSLASCVAVGAFNVMKAKVNHIRFCLHANQPADRVIAYFFLEKALGYLLYIYDVRRLSKSAK